MAVKTILTCDKCEKTLELEGPYHVAKPAMKEAGWKNVKVGDGWEIRCTGCEKRKG